MQPPHITNPIEHKPKVFYRNPDNQWKPAACDQCIVDKLGDRVDVQWDIKEGVMRLSRSAENVSTCYERNQQHQVEKIKGAYFYHAVNCPFLNQQIVKNPEKFIKPCACVMLYHQQKNQILITERSPALRTFPNSWVLPGGHLQPGEGMFEGGIRQCEQQVGLPSGINTCHPLKQNAIMIWQSCFTMDGHIKACAMVVFFVAFCEQFQVKIDPREVAEYKWKKLDDKTGQVRYTTATKTGYAEGHLKYLQMVRKHIKKQEQN